MTPIGPGAGPYARATLGFGIRHEEAVLQWLAELPPEFRQRQGKASHRRHAPRT